MSDSKLSLPQASPEGAFYSSSPEPLVFNFLHTFYTCQKNLLDGLLSDSCSNGKHPDCCWASWKSRASWKCLNHRFIWWLRDPSSSLPLVFVSYWTWVDLNLVASFCSMKRQLIGSKFSLGMNHAGHGPSSLQWWMATNFLTNSQNKEPLRDAQHAHDALSNLSCHALLVDSQLVVL